jgi:hypothetical protein
MSASDNAAQDSPEPTPSTDDSGPDAPRPDAPWQVDGVSDVARLAAESAAADEGRALGLWIEDAIRDAARPAPVTTDDIVAAIDALGARIATAETTTRQAIVPLRDRLGRLSQQLADVERSRTGNAETDTEAS